MTVSHAATSAMTYDEKRQHVKDTMDRIGLPLTEIVTETSYNYTYVADVLRGEPGKRSNPCLDAVAEELERRGITTRIGS